MAEPVAACRDKRIDHMVLVVGPDEPHDMQSRFDLSLQRVHLLRCFKVVWRADAGLEAEPSSHGVMHLLGIC